MRDYDPLSRACDRLLMIWPDLLLILGLSICEPSTYLQGN